MSKMSKAKQVAPSNEIVVQIGDVEVVILKVSNIFKVGDKVMYLSQIVWEEVTESVISEITEKLKK